jgi:hypothetical protein
MPSWLVLRGIRLLTSSFSRTASALRARSKQGVPHGSTAIRRERKLKSKVQGNPKENRDNIRKIANETISKQSDSKYFNPGV